jgi:hypothetical protein
MINSLMEFGWWADDSLTPRDNCEVVVLDRPTKLSKESIIYVANLFRARCLCEGGKIRVYFNGSPCILEGISGCWLWETDMGNDNNEYWQLRITDDDRDLLVTIKEPRGF